MAISAPHREGAKRRKREFGAAVVMENRSQDVAGLRDLMAYKDSREAHERREDLASIGLTVRDIDEATRTESTNSHSADPDVSKVDNVCGTT